MRWFVVLAAGLIAAACAPREPSEADLLRALQRHHEEWAAAQRRQMPQDYAPVVNLPFQAALTLHIHTIRKERCVPAVEESGFVCTVAVEASTAYAPHLRRRMEARFVEGTRGWLALSPRSLDPPVSSPSAAAN